MYNCTCRKETWILHQFCNLLKQRLKDIKCLDTFFLLYMPIPSGPHLPLKGCIPGSRRDHPERNFIFRGTSSASLYNYSGLVGGWTFRKVNFLSRCLSHLTKLHSSITLLKSFHRFQIFHSFTHPGLYYCPMENMCTRLAGISMQGPPHCYYCRGQFARAR